MRGIRTGSELGVSASYMSTLISHSRLPALDAPSGTGTPSTAAAKSNQRSQSSSISAHALLYLDANLRAFLTEILYEVLAVAERGGLRGGRDGRAAGRVVDAQVSVLLLSSARSLDVWLTD